MKRLAFALALSLPALAAAQADPHAHHHHGGAAPEVLPAGPPTEASLYELEAPLVDQAAKKVKLDLFRGHPVLVSMFYASCTNACPLLIAKLNRLQGKLSPRAREAARVLLVSLDPARDTPEALAKLATQAAADARWTLARAPEGSVREIAAALGIRYRFAPDGSVNHSSVLTLLDGKGKVVARIEGLDTPDDALVQKLEALVAGS